MSKKFAIIISLALVAETLCSQPGTQLVSPVPQSPNAASIAKFTETPVNLYSGVPSVDIPVYSVKSKGFDMDISLSYHSGGIKVEEIASWVGTGWALNAGGSISRSIRGIADESPTGFLSSIAQTKFLQFKNNQMSESQQYQYLSDINEGLYDSEPDLFYYSVAGLSGKFYWGNNNKWNTIPKTNIKIDGTPTAGFIITDTRGFQYEFNIKETVNSQPIVVQLNGATETPGSNSTDAPSAWYLNTVYNQTGATCVSIEYDPTYYTAKLLGSETKYQSISGVSDCPPKSGERVFTNNTFMGWRIRKINFTNGYIQFIKTSATRCDLPGDYALDSIKVFSNQGNLIKAVKFFQSIRGGNTSTCDLSDAINKRLFLDSVKVIPDMVFKYEYDAQELPSRYSFSQDFWGFYNGQNNNSLVPGYSYTLYGGSTVIVQGANRNPDLNTKAGTLTKVVYPTGGFSEFEYELNSARVHTSQTQVLPTQHTFSVPGDYSGATNYHDTAFAISSGGFTGIVNGVSYDGVLANINIYGVTCPLIPVNEGCGNVRLQCISPTNIFSIYLNHSQQGVFLPQGIYRLTADFTSNTDIESYRNFSYYMNWQGHDSLTQQTQYVTVPTGGLRIKTIKTDDGFGNKVQKNYSYTIPGTNTSSGMVAAMPKYEDISTFVSSYNVPGIATVGLNCSYIRRSSSSLYPLLVNTSSSTGYSYVTVDEDKPGVGSNGKTVYHFTNVNEYPDLGTTVFPYPPVLAQDWKRGATKTEKQYAASGTSYTLQSEKKKGYATLDGGQSVYANTSDALKVGCDFISTATAGLSGYKYDFYTISNGWMSLTTDTTVMYPQSGSGDITTRTNYFYDNENNLQPTRTEITNSKGELLKTISRTPLEKAAINAATPLTPTASAAIDDMLAKNIIAPTIQTESYKAGNLLTRTLTNYKIWSPAVTDIETVQVQMGAGPLKTKQLAHAFDLEGNILSMQKADDTRKSFIYDYQNSYPVAGVVNASNADIGYTSFEADGKGNWTFTGTGTADATAPTGKKSYNLSNGPVSKTTDNTKTYIISLWKNVTVSVNGTLYRTGRTINGWTYVEYQVSNASSVTISGSGSIDELRLYPKNAVMTSYTYEPLIGMTSQSDANGNITYYEYDAFGRLKYIKDMDKNIIKVMDYKYKAGVTE